MRQFKKISFSINTTLRVHLSLTQKTSLLDLKSFAYDRGWQNGIRIVTCHSKLRPLSSGSKLRFDIQVLSVLTFDISSKTSRIEGTKLTSWGYVSRIEVSLPNSGKGFWININFLFSSMVRLNSTENHKTFNL